MSEVLTAPTVTATPRPAAPPIPDKPAWTPPAVDIGDIVLFHHGRNSSSADPNLPMASVVTEVCGNGRLKLCPIEKDAVGFKYMEDAVCHKNDPQREWLLSLNPDNGYWDHRPGHLLAHEVAHLRKLMTDMGLGKKGVA